MMKYAYQCRLEMIFEQKMRNKSHFKSSNGTQITYSIRSTHSQNWICIEKDWKYSLQTMQSSCQWWISVIETQSYAMAQIHCHKSNTNQWKYRWKSRETLSRSLINSGMWKMCEDCSCWHKGGHKCPTLCPQFRRTELFDGTCPHNGE